MIIPVILAGGLGTRLWPVSRPEFPKPLIRLNGPLSMIQETVLRAGAIPGSDDPVIVCGEAHHPPIARQLDEIGCRDYLALLEPMGRGTAPAAAAAAMVADEDDLLLVMPADHAIENREAFGDAIALASRVARAGWLVTFGVTPHRPETGYGYIECGEPIQQISGSFRIASFREKPDLATAVHYLESGRYWWNSGMFLFRAATFLEELRAFDPVILRHVESALAGSPARNTTRRGRTYRMLDPESFSASPPGSIDRTVMERTRRGAMVPLRAGWNDVGSWEALWYMGGKDETGNVLSGTVHVQDVTSSYISAGERPVVVLGLDRVIVIDSGDALLVAGMDHAQAVKGIAQATPRKPDGSPRR